MPKISVIVPVYNVAPYIRRCLDSLVVQSMDSIEIICINDASKDSSREILQEFASRDERVTCIDFNKNLGVSAARNAGMVVATGEYIGFVDSDDYITKDFFKKLYSAARRKRACIAKGSLRWITENNEQVIYYGSQMTKKNDFLDRFYTAIYKRRFIKNNAIFFPPGVTNGEDKAFLTKSISLAKKVVTVDEAQYVYVRRKNSAYTGEYTLSQFNSLMLMLEDINSFLNRNFFRIKTDDYAKLYAKSVFFILTRFNEIEKKSVSDAAKIYAAGLVRYYKKCKTQLLLKKEIITFNKEFYQPIIDEDYEYLIFLIQKQSRQATSIFSTLRKNYKSKMHL